MTTAGPLNVDMLVNPDHLTALKTLLDKMSAAIGEYANTMNVAAVQKHIEQHPELDPTGYVDRMRGVDSVAVVHLSTDNDMLTAADSLLCDYLQRVQTNLYWFQPQVSAPAGLQMCPNCVQALSTPPGQPTMKDLDQAREDGRSNGYGTGMRPGPKSD